MLLLLHQVDYKLLDQVVYNLLDQVVYNLLDQVVYNLLDQVVYKRGNGIYRKHYLYGGGVALYARVVLSRCYFVVLVVALKSKLASC